MNRLVGDDATIYNTICIYTPDDDTHAYLIIRMHRDIYIICDIHVVVIYVEWAQ